MTKGDKVLGIIFPNTYDSIVPELTNVRLMASIPFASRYRMIDFVLSGMSNSGIDNISLLVNKNYHSLMDHLGSGKEWDLHTRNNGLFILPVLSALSQFFMTKLTGTTQPAQNNQSAEQEAAANAMNSGFMKWFFPIFSVWICATSNAAFSIYWMAVNVISIVQKHSEESNDIAFKRASEDIIGMYSELLDEVIDDLQAIAYSVNAQVGFGLMEPEAEEGEHNE